MKRSFLTLISAVVMLSSAGCASASHGSQPSAANGYDANTSPGSTVQLSDVTFGQHFCVKKSAIAADIARAGTRTFLRGFNLASVHCGSGTTKLTKLENSLFTFTGELPVNRANRTMLVAAQDPLLRSPLLTTFASDLRTGDIRYISTSRLVRHGDSNAFEMLDDVALANNRLDATYASVYTQSDVDSPIVCLPAGNDNKMIPIDRTNSLGDIAVHYIPANFKVDGRGCSLPPVKPAGSTLHLTDLWQDTQYYVARKYAYPARAGADRVELLDPAATFETDPGKDNGAHLLNSIARQEPQVVVKTAAGIELSLAEPEHHDEYYAPVEYYEITPA